ncbi:MAG: PepSY domain-containing protein [Burkholderiaceae bacterium]
MYLRWPRRPSSPSAWLTSNPRLKGRPFPWSLHSVVATWMNPAWVILAATGIYWAFDPVRQPLADTTEAWFSSLVRFGVDPTAPTSWIWCRPLNRRRLSPRSLVRLEGRPHISRLDRSPFS